MLLTLGVLSAALTHPAQALALGKGLCTFSSVTRPLVYGNADSRASHVGVAGNLEQALAHDLGSIPQIRHILTRRVDGPLLVWIAVDSPDPSVRRKVYRKELALLEGFPEVQFDFNLIPAMGRSAEEIATDARVVYSR